MQHQQKLVQLSLKLLGRLPDTTDSHHLQNSTASAVLAFIAALYAPEPPQIPDSQVNFTRCQHVHCCMSGYILPTFWHFTNCMQNVQCLRMQ